MNEGLLPIAKRGHGIASNQGAAFDFNEQPAFLPVAGLSPMRITAPVPSGSRMALRRADLHPSSCWVGPALFIRGVV